MLALQGYIIGHSTSKLNPDSLGHSCLLGQSLTDCTCWDFPACHSAQSTNRLNQTSGTHSILLHYPEVHTVIHFRFFSSTSHTLSMVTHMGNYFCTNSSAAAEIICPVWLYCIQQRVFAGLLHISRCQIKATNICIKSLSHEVVICSLRWIFFLHGKKKAKK